MTFFPEPGVGEYVAVALGRGAAVVKLHLQVGGYDPRDPRLQPAWEQVASAGTPVVVHCGSGPLPGAFTGVGPIREVLQAFPSLRLVIAHLGAPEYEGFLDLAQQFPSVSLDTTMVATDYLNAIAPVPGSLLPALRELASDGRIVFGSDFPSIPYPFAHQIEALARLGLGDEVMRAVLWRNGSRLLKVPDHRGAPGHGDARPVVSPG